MFSFFKLFTTVTSRSDLQPLILIYIGIILGNKTFLRGNPPLIIWVATDFDSEIVFLIFAFGSLIFKSMPVN